MGAAWRWIQLRLDGWWRVDSCTVKCELHLVCQWMLEERTVRRLLCLVPGVFLGACFNFGFLQETCHYPRFPGGQGAQKRGMLSQETDKSILFAQNGNPREGVFFSLQNSTAWRCKFVSAIPSHFEKRGQLSGHLAGSRTVILLYYLGNGTCIIWASSYFLLPLLLLLLLPR